MTGTYAAAVRRILIGRVLATAGAIIAFVGTFMPWVRSGRRRRNSYAIFSLVDRLGFSQSDLVGWGIRLWPVVPLLLVSAVALLWFARRLIGAVATAVVVVYAGAVSIAVWSAPSSSLIHVERGPVVTVCGVATLAAGALIATV